MTGTGVSSTAHLVEIAVLAPMAPAGAMVAPVAGLTLIDPPGTAASPAPTPARDPTPPAPEDRPR